MAVFTNRHVICCLLFSVAVVSAGPPEFVYRADSRSHEDVFESGFPALGDNDDVYDHLSGASCQGRDKKKLTAFIDTTDDETYAMEVWGPELLDDGKRVINIYEIRATQNFYNSWRSMKFYHHHMPFSKQPQPRALEKFAVPKNRWIAHGGIPASLIKKVTQYQYLIGDGWMGIETQNTNYQTSSSHGNFNPYVPNQHTTQGSTSFSTIPGTPACIPKISSI